jgi:hypothetical protein
MKVKNYFGAKPLKIFYKKITYQLNRIYLPDDRKDAFAYLKASKFVLSLHRRI